MKKILGFAILASFLATPAFAGETFVRNEWTNSNSHTDSKLNLDSKTTSTRKEDYSSWAEKIYIDGDVEANVCKTKCGGSTEVSFDDFTIHAAGSELNGHFKEDVVTKVYGTINTVTKSYSNSHETTAGVR
jgi:hypothetical protein